MSLSANILEFREVGFTYSGETAPALASLSCSFKRNSLNLLLGPSGCGKSTAMYMANGIIPHALEGSSRGAIIYEGTDIAGLKPQQLSTRIGFVFQDPESQFCTFTVEDEIAFGLENINTAPQTISQRISDSLALVGMAGSQKRLINDISGGEKQKIALASVLAMQPELIIMDEPTANLDPASTQETFALMSSLVKDYSKTLIVIEHKLDGLMDKVDHIVLMDEAGRTLLEGSPATVLRQLLYDEQFDLLTVYLPEHLLIIRSVFIRLAANGKIKTLRANELKTPIPDLPGVCPFDVDFGVKMLAGIAGLLGVDGFAELQPDNNSAGNILELEDIFFSYDKTAAQPLFGKQPPPDCDTHVLQGVDLKIKKGDFAAILGPNGSGKSTVLNTIFQINSGYQGRIALEAKDVKTLGRSKLYRELGLVFQNPEWQFVTNDVTAELLYSLKNSGLSEEEKSAAIAKMLSAFHLENERNQSPFLLSQGQKRRLSVAVMLLTGQKVLFLDEPTYGQDYENQLELMELMQSLNRQGVTIVLVTHDMSLAADYAATVHLLIEGRIRFSGSPEQLFNHEDLVEEGRLQKPPALALCQKLAAFLPWFPPLASKEKIIDLFCQSVLKEGK